MKNVNCEKCLELKYQLKEALQELCSNHLIIYLLRKENAFYMTLEHESTKPISSSKVSPERNK